MQTTIDQRFEMLRGWLNQTGLTIQKIMPLAADASFRRYFRVHSGSKTLMAMDAPPAKENSLPFVNIAKVFNAKNLQVPKVIACDLTQGFLLLSDLGDDLYFRILKEQNAEQLYQNAIKELLIIQTCKQGCGFDFPAFDDLMLEELQRFREWYLLKHLKLNLNGNEETLLLETFQFLIQSALDQPQVCVHRDYHSRNLLQLPENRVGILDFQDAVWGPITYDLVSLLRDCYIAWPSEQVEKWALSYYEQAKTAKLLNAINSQQFLRWFDLMGIQRHLKAIYIFARKFHRDNNPNYLGDIPRTLNYVLSVSEKYPELKNFREFLKIT